MEGCRGGCLPVLGVQRRINLVEQVEGRRVAALDGKDEGQRHEGLLPAAQLLHDKHLPRAEGDLPWTLGLRGAP